MTRTYIRGHLGYHFTICADGTEALAVEYAVRGGALLWALTRHQARR